MKQIIMSFFDYIYYRLAKLYFKTDGKDSIAPIAILTLTQIFICIDLLSLFYAEVLAKAFSMSTLGLSKFLYVIVAILLLIYNYRRYKNKFNLFNERWNGEPKKVKISKGILILIFIISVIAFSGIHLNIRNS
jgi:hypothetical protein